MREWHELTDAEQDRLCDRILDAIERDIADIVDEIGDPRVSAERFRQRFREYLREQRAKIMDDRRERGEQVDRLVEACIKIAECAMGKER